MNRYFIKILLYFLIHWNVDFPKMLHNCWLFPFHIPCGTFNQVHSIYEGWTTCVQPAPPPNFRGKYVGSESPLALWSVGTILPCLEGDLPSQHFLAIRRHLGAFSVPTIPHFCKNVGLWEQVQSSTVQGLAYTASRCLKIMYPSIDLDFLSFTVVLFFHTY